MIWIPQGNMTSGFGIDKNELKTTSYDLLVNEDITMNDCIIKNVFPWLSVLPSNRNLAGAEIELLTVENMQYILREKMEEVIEDYDFIIIDCPPALGMLTVNAMTAADTVIVPIQCEFYALDGLTQLIYTIGLIQNSLKSRSGNRRCCIHNV